MSMCAGVTVQRSSSTLPRHRDPGSPAGISAAPLR